MLSNIALKIRSSETMFRWAPHSKMPQLSKIPEVILDHNKVIKNVKGKITRIG